MPNQLNILSPYGGVNDLRHLIPRNHRFQLKNDAEKTPSDETKRLRDYELFRVPFTGHGGKHAVLSGRLVERWIHGVRGLARCICRSSSLPHRPCFNP